MSLVNTQVNCNTPVDIGSALQYAAQPDNIGLNTTVPANGSVQSQLIITNGFKSFAFGVKSTQAGSVSIQRNLDQAGTIPVGTPITVSLTANTAAAATCTDGVPFQSISITVNNSGGSPATLSNCLLLLQAN